jgi:hypothetical protein
MQSINGFKNEAAVAKVIDLNTDASGIYALPHVAKAGDKPAVTKPTAFVNVVKEEMRPDAMKCAMIGQAVMCLLLGALLTCLLKKVAGCPVSASIKAGLLAAIASEAPNVVWMHFPVHNALLNGLDIVVGFALAGIAISKFVTKAKIGGCCDTDKKGGCCN